MNSRLGGGPPLAAGAVFFFCQYIYGCRGGVLTMPLLIVPVLLGALIVFAHIPYPVYIQDTRWLVWLLGPTTIAFAVPIYEYRHTIRRHWLSLGLGVSTGLVTGTSISLLLARLLQLSP